MVEFKVFIRKFSEEEDLVAATPEAIRKAEEWLSQLVSEGATDLYKSLTELVKLPPTPGRPRIIFLVSDGRPQAQIWEDSEIINQVTQINQLRASVFTFGAGRKINTSLLDLLSYRNRGLRMFETDDKKIAQSLFDFYRSFSSPILMNPRFNFGSLDSTEVYPKALPDLYLHSRLQLFGRFEGEGEFSMQLLGEAEGQTKEYVLQQKLARKDNADATVAQQWAFRKIYHLVGRIVQEGESQAIRSEIERLSAGYSVRTPYSRGAAAGSAGGGR
jgi:Ca-activated chloride channel family protein